MKIKATYFSVAILTTGMSATNLHAETTSAKQKEIAKTELSITGVSPWPAIRKKRIASLLPDAMDSTHVQHWLIVCRENDNDPIAKHVGCENAGGTAVVLFSRTDSGVYSRIFSPVSESTSLKELNTFDDVIDVDRKQSAINVASDWLQAQDMSGDIAVNSFSQNPQSDGLSHSQYLALSNALKGGKIQLVSAESLIYYWLARKLPEEVAIMAKSAEVTSNWEYEAYQQVIPGVTSDKDIANFLKKKIADAGVQDGWAPDQNPAVNSGPDRGHSHPTNRIIQPGDIIQIDFGIRVFGQWVTDIQRFAYVLEEGESKAPASIQHAWDSAFAGSQAAFAAMKPGVAGSSVHKAQQVVMEQAGSLSVMWSTGHPVGYVAHDTGPNLGVREESKRKLDIGMTFAFDGFYSWYYPGSDKQKTKTISVEEMVVITEDGAKFLTTPQQSLILIPNRTK